MLGECIVRILPSQSTLVASSLFLLRYCERCCSSILCSLRCRVCIATYYSRTLLRGPMLQVFHRVTERDYAYLLFAKASPGHQCFSSTLAPKLPYSCWRAHVPDDNPRATLFSIRRACKAPSVFIVCAVAGKSYGSHKLCCAVPIVIPNSH
ncbi:uncharacterized protein LAESUDRAFT_726725 [Laetiporus sulphureus 93-53]|uniref:Uncharacterized protein n=1 Tax=Laetiporus sulphureus 93-53 TaxID=1314785 RepID=A0A165DWH6_9APHY|nr:uncharacterized protein LAESUDRAFT_726725 [Laetiporus sulphureus 93-53]KZT05774.1 hypothetical protein LAESUDRAFT_726725 [Laetiporus sulphureus 93-53]